MIWHWLAHFTGLDYGVSYGHVILYNFWSGIGSDISEITLAGLVYGAWRKHACHTEHCWRIGRHQVNGTPWCNKHHQAARDLRIVAQEEYPELREPVEEGDHA